MNNMTINMRNFLGVAIIVFGLGAVAGVNGQGTSDKPVINESSRSSDKQNMPQTNSKDGKVIISVPILMMVPVEVSTNTEKGGCWVRLYDKKNYEGESLMLAGPISLGRMVGPFGFDWENKVRSLQTGQKTNLTIFDNRNFQDDNKFIGEGKRVPDMSEKMGFFDNFRSMMVTCPDAPAGS